MKVGAEASAPPWAGAWPFLLVFVSALAVLLTAEAPALWTVFAHHDQYRFFIETLDNPAIAQSCEANREYLWAYKIGRPLTAELECMIFRHVKVPADLTPFRFAAVALQALAAAVFALTLRGCRLSWLAAGALGIAVFLLPGELNAVAMANFANVLAPTLAVASYGFLQSAGRGRTWPHGWRGLALAAAAWGCLMAACHLFLGLVVFFFVASFAQALLDAERYNWSRAIRDIVFFVSVALPYYLLLLLFYLPRFDQGQAVPPSYSTELTPESVLAGLVKLLLLLSPMANLWNIYPFAGVLLVLVVIVLAARVVADLRHSPALGRIGGPGAGRLLLLLTLFGAANVVLVVSPVWIVYRLMTAQSAILLLWLFASLWAISEIWHPLWRGRAEQALALAIAAVAAIFAGQTMSESVVASALERAYIRNVIASAPAGSFERIAIVEPPTDPRHPRGLNGRAYASDEFNMPSTRGSSNLGSEVPEMVRAAMLELGRRDRPIVDAGQPMRAAGTAHVTLLADERVRVEAPNGWTAEGEIRNGLIFLPMAVIGELSADRRTIRWNTGVIWSDGPSGLAGAWRAELDPAAIPVLRLPPGKRPSAPGTLVIDMAKAAFPTGRL